jgi:hypothetical protein
MAIINDNRYIGGLHAQRDGSQMKVTARFVSRTQSDISDTYTRSMPPAEYGEWTYEFLRTTDPGPNLRLMMDDDGLIIAIGHETEDRWFDPRAPGEISSAQKQEQLVESAVKFINAHRRGYGHRALDRTGWSNDDVFKHARELGWSEAT